MPSTRHRPPSKPTTAACLVAFALGAGSAEAALVNISDIDFDTDWATSTATITGGGYVTPHGTALFSGDSQKWSVADSLGTYFQVPTFQPSYDPDNPVDGLPGTPATLGQDERYFPWASQNERDIIQLGWGGQSLQNLAGDDLVIYEAATSEAFAVQVHIVDALGAAIGWSGWYYRPYWEPDDRPASSVANDTTPTLIDLGALGVGSNYIDALEITNLLPDDTLGAEITSVTDHAEVFFGGSATPGEDYAVLRYSNTSGTFVEFEAGKFDPDIQYVAGLHAPVVLATGDLSPFSVSAGTSFPDRLAPTDVPLPIPGAPLLLIPGLWLLARGRRA